MEQYREELLLLGGRLVDPENVSAGEDRSAGEAQPAGETRTTDSRRLMLLSADKALQVIAINKQHAETIQEAIGSTGRVLAWLAVGSAPLAWIVKV